jgi:hypothetical protein
MCSKALFESENLDIIPGRVFQVHRARAVAMLLWLPVIRRITQQSEVWRMLLWKNKRQANIRKFNKRPRLVLVAHFAFKMFRVPIHGLLNIGNGDGYMMHGIEFCFGLKIRHRFSLLS